MKKLLMFPLAVAFGALIAASAAVGNPPARNGTRGPTVSTAVRSVRP